MIIEIYSKTTCPFCHMAKDYLRKSSVPYREMIFDDDEQRSQMYDDLGLEGNERTVPQIFVIDNERRTRIGGYTNLTQSDVVARHLIGDFSMEF